jgi:hypothetical protein
LAFALVIMECSSLSVWQLRENLRNFPLLYSSIFVTRYYNWF